VALVSGTLLAATYQLTKEKIEQGVIDRQTSAINDLFNTIEHKELIEVPSEFATKGVQTIVKVESEGKEYNCYTISFKDGVGGDEGVIIIALDSDAKVYGVKFVTTGDSYMAKYNDDTYLASVVNNDKFDAIGGATVTAGDLNKVLSLAKECFGGKIVEPIDELFENSISSKENIEKPTGIDESVNSIQRVTSNNTTYYVYDVTFKDTFGGDITNVLYALNENGSLFRIKIVEGDGYSSAFNMMEDLDSISNATAIYTGEDIIEYYNLVKELNDTIVEGV